MRVVVTRNRQLVTRMLAMLALLLSAGAACAQDREAWIRKCQQEDSELANSNGYRVCTELYGVELQKHQDDLVSRVVSMLAQASDEGIDPALAREHFVESQDFWQGYVEAHCKMAQAMFGNGNPSGDTIPSCMAGELENRNEQLERILQGQYER